MPFMPISRQVGEPGVVAASWRRLARLHPRISFAWIVLALLVIYQPYHKASPPDLSAYPWLFLRDGQALQVNEKSIEVIFAGDVVIESGPVAAGEWNSLSMNWLLSADLAVANFEGAIVASSQQADSTSDGSRSNPMQHLMPATAAADLAMLGFDLVSLANNHSLDAGNQGLHTTVDLLQSKGLDTVGGFGNLVSSPPSIPGLVLRQVNGLRLAFLAYTTITPVDSMDSNDANAPLIYEPGAAGEAVRAATGLADVVVVLIHWGEEYSLRPHPGQERIAQELVAAGADLIVGSHPHVPQATQVISPTRLSGKSTTASFVAYSLGNFIFPQSFIETSQGLALRVFLDGQGLRAVQGLPVNSGARPGLVSPEQLPAWMNRVIPIGERIVFSCDSQSCRHTSGETSALPSGVFYAGEVDLTGDGSAERVFRRGSQVFIYDGKALVWKSPGEWQVTDLAIGDPNDDGRSEILLSVRKPDGAGIIRSHPFIVGYRQGIYRLLWGGSAVSEPIRELELADVDADGKQDIVVLEDARQGKQTVSIWRWHGWGFTLTWRSEPGWYQNLGIIIAMAGQPDRFQVEQLWAPAE